MPLQLSVQYLLHILHKCIVLGGPSHGLRLRAYMRTCGLQAHSSLGNHLVSVLVEAGCVHDAQQVFNNLPHWSNWSWNPLIVGYITHGKPHHALFLYEKMRTKDPAQATAHTLVALLKACTKLKDMERGLEIHADISKMRLLEGNAYIGSTLVDM
eukprot:c10722_g1_i1 orf=102-566(+)